ncbi:putative mucin TcMUCII [Trypanosoma cruzi]|uniref:Putative mucin TcMUCII n=1 Tax=Trypanosoma cruzi TaxID=5693 RepID=A0A2V2VX94_TRYCR|nr:putative mucin TcMUCII [Trypanosoma cruzi]
MMTCRLLCALLVLALCCCPSVCVAETQSGPEAFSTTPMTTIARPPVPNEKANHKPNVGVGSPPPLPEPSNPTSGQPGVHSNEAAAERGNTAGDAGNLPSPHSQSSGAHNAVQGKSTEDTTGPQSRTSTSTEQANKNVDDSTEETTTTTTKPPTTTTTTTTQAPSTTTTEAPTTTTTRAPSRLREVDGSLSSSAWVCAPLLLAVSALAYTTLG